MIIDWETDSLHYEAKIREKGNMDYQCPVCRKKSTLKRHGFYKRNMILWFGHKEEKLLYILRVQCTTCKSTHAVLPNDAVPYKVYSIPFYVKMLRILYQFKRHVSLCVKWLEICHVQIYHVIHQIQREFQRCKKTTKSWQCHSDWTWGSGKKRNRQILVYTTWIVNSQNV